jgi:hypothetical protein
MMLNEALSQGLKLEVTNVMTEPPARLWVVRAKVSVGEWSLDDRHRTEWPVCWQCEDISLLGGTFHRNVLRRTAWEVNWDPRNK